MIMICMIWYDTYDMYFIQILASMIVWKMHFWAFRRVEILKTVWEPKPLMYLTLPFLSKIGTVQWSLISLWYTAEYSDELKQKGTLA